MKNKIGYTSIEFKNNLILLALDGISLFELDYLNIYQFSKSLKWSEEEPIKTLRELIGEDINSEEYVFLLDDNLSKLEQVEREFGTGWHYNLRDDEIEISINGIFNQNTIKFSIDLETYGTINRFISALQLEDLLVLLKFPNKDFRYFVHLNENNVEETKFSVDYAINFPRLNGFETITSIPKEDLTTNSIPNGAEPTEIFDLTSDKKNTELRKNRAAVFFMLDELKETALLTARHIFEYSSNPIIIEIGLWCSHLNSHLSTYISVYEKFELINTSFSTDDVEKFADFIAANITKFIDRDIFFVFDKNVTLEMKIDDLVEVLLSKELPIDFMLSMFKIRNKVFDHITNSMENFSLITGDGSMAGNHKLHNTHVYNINFNIMTKFLMPILDNTSDEKLRSVVMEIKKIL